jgi:hypothetical protein
MDPSEYTTIDEFIQLKHNITQKPQNYVLKPQREGGGNNLYGEVINN